ncbi:MAG: ABC transporter permease [Nitrospinota bacterium]
MKEELVAGTAALEAALPQETMAPEEPHVLVAAWQSLRRNKVALAGALALLFMTLVALFPQYFVLHSPYEQNPALGAKPPLFVDKETGWLFLLGTDAIGRDLLSRIVYGARVSLAVGLTTVVISGTIGVLIGLVSGFYGGWVDNVLMRIVDVFLAFPFVLLALCLVAILKPSLFIVIVAISVRIWVPYARLVRGSALSVREMEFVVGARAAGLNTLAIMFKYVLPNVLAPAVVVATLSVGRMIIIEASLSFLGLGVPPPNPTWGGMLADGRNYIDSAWWICVFPGMAIMLTVLSTNLLGDWFRDFIDPRLKGVD